ncbi:MAG: Ig-like domain-containing protein [Chloroflexota bacterium]|nr:Ig-like domain-containing protein [Chloroflexota bacterium]
MAQRVEPSVTTDIAQIPLENTPTLIAGAATFTPEPSNKQGANAGKPRVLGITAGVGMREGDIGGTPSLAVSFSQTMDHAATQAAFQLVPAVAGNFAWSADTLLFTPGHPLAPDTLYKVTMAEQAKAQSGITVAAPMSASFKTAPPPSVLRTLPGAGAVEVPTDAIVTVTFNHPMIPLTALSNQPDAGQWVVISPAVKGHWVWLGTSAAGFRADNGLQPATAYTLDIKPGWPDAYDVPMQQGTTTHFTTIKPAVLEVEPSNGSTSVPLDSPLIVRFNMPMDHSSVESAASLPLPASSSWSPDSTVVTFTHKSLLSFSTIYHPALSGKVRPAGGELTGLAGTVESNSWSFTTTSSTVVDSHSPNSDLDHAQPSPQFSFSFNNPIAPGQNVAALLTIDPKPRGYVGQVQVDTTTIYTSGIKLLPNTTYSFRLKAGLKDKWGFPVAPASWTVQIGPLPPSLSLGGGSFQPVYSEGPSRVSLQATNLDKLTLHLYALSESDVREIIRGNLKYDATGQMEYPGSLKREWDVSVHAGQENKATTLYPTVALSEGPDRLPVGYYILRATAATAYNSGRIEQWTVLGVGRSGAVIKAEGRNLFVWVADLGNGKPLSGYKLRVEQLPSVPGQPVVQSGVTGSDGVMRMTLDKSDASLTAVWGGVPGDAMLATTGWSRNVVPEGNANFYGGSSAQGNRAAIYTDRPIYRPAQTVYFRGTYRLDDDAHYSLPTPGIVLQVRAITYNGGRGPTAVYTGTATLSPLGTLSGQFLLPAGVPTGDYTLNLMSTGDIADLYSSGLASASFKVEEYRKPDFQVGVTAAASVVHGDPVTATVSSSYYFGGPLQNMTATINLRSYAYYFGWSDPNTGESYTFGNGGPPPYYGYANSAGDYAGQGYASPIRPPFPGGPPTVDQVTHRIVTRTDKDGFATVDVSRYVTTTEGSRTLLVEGQIQDLSNQAVANSTTVTVHQGSYYVGLRVSDYVATAKQPLTVTVRTVRADGMQLQAGASVKLRFVRQEWVAPPVGSSEDWQQKETPTGETTVTTDGKGRAVYLFTTGGGGQYAIYAEAGDSRGNSIKSNMSFYVSSPDPEYVPWRYSNSQQVALVADKQTYKIGDVARILVTSPFTQATALLTVERGHIRRYRLVTLKGGAPTLEVPLEEGDVPNVYIGLTLLGNEKAPEGAPAGWADKITMRQGYVTIDMDSAGKQLSVTIEPQGKGPFLPGTTANVKVTTRDSSGKPTQGELSLAVVDEAIYALSGDNAANLFETYWGQRGLGVTTSSSFTSGEDGGSGGGIVNDSAASPTGVAPPSEAGRSVGAQPLPMSGAPEPAAPKKVRADFRDTAFWQASVTTGQDGTAIVPVPLPDNLTTWRLTAQGIDVNTRAGMASVPMTVTQPLLLRPVQPRFLIEGDNPNPQAIVHNNTASALQVEVSLVVSGALSLEAQPAAAQTLTVQPGTEAVITWSAHVGKGDTANLRYWVHTLGNAGQADYREDAVSAHLPVEPFAAPEAVATSGEVSGTRADESIFLPYSINPILGEMVIQVSPSLAAAATSSLHYVEEYPYESTDQTVSRFLPLVVLEKVYNEQGSRTQYSARIPGILAGAVKRLQDLQISDGGWGWWADGISSWWETGYVVQGLVAARDSGYSVPADMLARGIERLKGFQQSNGTPGIDETYHLDMRAYTLYVLAYAGNANDSMRQEGSDLVSQVPRLGVHARAWLAMSLGKMGMSAPARSVLDSLVAGARQSSTTAHWEEGTPDYWSMGTNTRATDMAIDALITLEPGDPLIPKAVRWIMTTEKEGHWLSTQETSASLIALAHYIRATKELTGDYAWQVTAFDKLIGSSVVNSTNITQTATLNVPVSGMPQNMLGNLGLARSNSKGKMYYQVSLRYYVPGEGIKSLSEGLSVTRSYYRLDGKDPVKSAAPGELLRVRLNIVVPETSYYVMLTDPLPAGLEGVNGSLNTTSFTERPPNPRGTDAVDEANSNGGNSTGTDAFWPWQRWGPFDNVEMRDDRTVLFANYMSPGTYVYEYYARATTPGTYMLLPTHAELLYYPDVFGHGDGGQFTVKQP